MLQQFSRITRDSMRHGRVIVAVVVAPAFAQPRSKSFELENPKLMSSERGLESVLNCVRAGISVMHMGLGVCKYTDASASAFRSAFMYPSWLDHVLMTSPELFMRQHFVCKIITSHFRLQFLYLLFLLLPSGS